MGAQGKILGIVSDIEGTTRDTIEESAQIKGIPLQLVDTAGILEPRDLIEKEAVKRSHMFIQQADLILFVVDVTQALNGQDQVLINQVKDKNTLVVLNKSDLKSKVSIPAVKKRIKDNGKNLLV